MRLLRLPQLRLLYAAATMEAPSAPPTSFASAASTAEAPSAPPHFSAGASTSIPSAYQPVVNDDAERDPSFSFPE